MSAAVEEKKLVSVAEYLALDRASAEKHEFFRGEVFAMSGASYEHNKIVSNLIVALARSSGGRCDVLPSDLRVLVPATGLYTYPDVSVVCDPPAFADDEQDILLNPSVLIEVLSDSTENYDRGKKFENYRSISTLTDYLLVAQDRALVEHYRRQGEGGWLLHEIREGVLSLPCGIVPLDDVYRRVLPAA